MATTERRGLKRTCQNHDCAMPFYDLNRTAFACPHCGSVFDLALVARELEAQHQRSQSGRFNSRRAAPSPQKNPRRSTRVRAGLVF